MRRCRTHKEVYLMPEEMNKMLAKYTKGKMIIEGKPDGTLKNSMMCYIVDGMVKFRFITSIEDGKVVDFICRKDGETLQQVTNGGVAARTFAQYYSFPALAGRANWGSASPLINYNRLYNNTRQQAWGYDLNSAYAAAMLKEWIDVQKAPKSKEIEVGKEVGFENVTNPDGSISFVTLREGWSNLVYDIIPTPQGVIDFINTWYTRKKNAKTPEEKAKAKGILNYTVGTFQNKNPCLRALIVNNCNDFIMNLLDLDSLFWNTDSIVSRVRRPDIEANLGDGIGQWKIEHEGVVAYTGNTYQWNDDKPSYRGMPKTWFPEDYDLLEDGTPECGNTWFYNKNTRQLEERK